MQIITHKCDIQGCKSEVSDHIKVKLQVIFTTEQTEGTSIEPRLTSEMYALDLCNEHYNQIVNGQYVYARGAQGYNTFYIPDQTIDTSKITRLEVIDHRTTNTSGNERAYILLHDYQNVIKVSKQDDDRTLKIFISSSTEH